MIKRVENRFLKQQIVYNIKVRFGAASTVLDRTSKDNLRFLNLKTKHRRTARRKNKRITRNGDVLE